MGRRKARSRWQQTTASTSLGMPSVRCEPAPAAEHRSTSLRSLPPPSPPRPPEKTVAATQTAIRLDFA